MNANLRKVIALCSITRSRLRGMPMDEAITESLVRAGVEATETNRWKIQRTADKIILAETKMKGGESRVVAG